MTFFNLSYLQRVSTSKYNHTGGWQFNMYLVEGTHNFIILPSSCILFMVCRLIDGEIEIFLVASVIGCPVLIGKNLLLFWILIQKILLKWIICLTEPINSDPVILILILQSLLCCPLNLSFFSLNTIDNNWMCLGCSLKRNFMSRRVSGTGIHWGGFLWNLIYFKIRLDSYLLCYFRCVFASGGGNRPECLSSFLLALTFFDWNLKIYISRAVWNTVCWK